MNTVGGMRAYTLKMHRGRGRQDGTPDAIHLRRVAAVLTAALKQTGETPGKKTLETLQCVALGHDLLEDTKASPDEIERIAGSEARGYIEALTNRLGDNHPKPYVRQVASASEEARLVKLADLYDNTTQASMNMAGLGPKWMREYFLPIIDPMRTAVSKTRFVKYPKTGALLIEAAAIARAHLGESLANISAKGKWPS